MRFEGGGEERGSERKFPPCSCARYNGRTWSFGGSAACCLSCDRYPLGSVKAVPSYSLLLLEDLFIRCQKPSV